MRLRRPFLCLATALATLPAAAAPPPPLRLVEGKVFDAKLAPGGEWVVYLEQVGPSSGDNALFARRRSGGPAVRLSFSDPPAVQVRAPFLLSRDGRRVVFKAAAAGAGFEDLWTVPITGPPSAAERLTPAQISGTFISQEAIDPTGARVVYHLQVPRPGGGLDRQVWSGPVAGGGEAVRLSPPPAGNGSVFASRVSPVGTRVVFSGDLATPGKMELWSVPIAGPAAAAVTISPPGAGPDPDVQSGSFVVSPDGARVAFLADFVTDGVTELWSVPVAGPAAQAIRLSPTPVAGGDVSFASLRAIDSPGSRVIFRGDLLVDERHDLWSAPLAGPAGSAVRISPDLPAAGDVTAAEILDDGARVALLADATIDEAFELWTVPIAGPASAADRIHPIPAAPPGVVNGSPSFLATTDAARLVFRADLDGENSVALWSAPAVGPAEDAVRLSAPAPAEGEVLGFELLPDGSRTVFFGDLVDDEQFLLYSAALDGAGGMTHLLLSLGFVPEADVTTRRLTADGRYVAFLADPFVDNRFELFRRAPSGPSTFEQLSPPIVPAGGGVAQDFVVSEDGFAVLFRADAAVNDRFDLWISDERIFAADHDEEADLSEWSAAVP